MKLLYNASVYVFDETLRRFVRHASLLIDGARVLALDEQPVGVRIERIDCRGAAIVPGFIDCHVHLAEAGYYAEGRSLAGIRSYDAFASAVRDAPTDVDMLYLGQYDDARWSDGSLADAAPLERYHADAFAMLVRVDSHSTIVNRKTFAWLGLSPETKGIERDNDGLPTGRLFYDANWRAIEKFVARIPIATRRASERRAAAAALRAGTLSLHAQLLGRDAAGYADDIAFLRALPIDVHPKICEPDAALARDLGLPYVGGDVFLDGSIGSCTAAVSRPYERGRGLGDLRLHDDELLAYFAGAESLGIAAGVHAIGDAAIEQCVRTWERVLGGRPSSRGARHFIEHFEMPDGSHVDACARMGIHLSMQPQFQATWGIPGGMYDDRLGEHRRAKMNPLRRVVESGAVLCGGSDAPVCALSPLEGMRAATQAQAPGECLDVHAALAIYTVNAARLGYAESRSGNLLAGMPCDAVVLDRDPIAAGSFEGVSVRQVWRAGCQVDPSALE